MIRKSVIILTIVLFSTACAWKGPEIKAEQKKQEEEKSQLPSTSPKTKEPLAKPAQEIDFSIQWKSSTVEGGYQKLTRKISERNDVPKDFYLDRPITLSAIVPTEVDLDFNVSKLNLNLNEEFTIVGKTDSFDLILKNSALSIVPDHVLVESVDNEDHLKLILGGLRNIFSDLDQQKAFITLDLRYAKTNLKAASIFLSLVTPPKRVLFEQLPLSELDPGHKLSALDLNKLQSPAKKLELIQLIKTQNRTGENIVIEIPARLNGKLWQKRRWYNPQPRMKGTVFVDKELCLDTTDEKNRDYTFAEQFYILPLSAELKENWISVLTDNKGILSIAAGQEKLFGLFAENSKSETPLKKALNESRATEHYTHNYRREATMQTINTKCDYGCYQAQNYPRFFTQCEEISADQPDWKTQCQERVSACSACVQLRLPGSYTTIWDTICNQCHALETLEGINQIFDYHGIRACDQWGTKALQTKQATWGEIADPVVLDLDSEEIRALVRFDYLDRNSDPEGRKFAFLKASSALE
jgi:hypothetical protein